MPPFGPVLSAAGIMMLVWLCDVLTLASRPADDATSWAAWRPCGLAGVLLAASWLLQGPAPQERLVFMLQLLTTLAVGLALAQGRVHVAHVRRSRIGDRSG